MQGQGLGESQKSARLPDCPAVSVHLPQLNLERADLRRGARTVKCTAGQADTILLGSLLKFQTKPRSPEPFNPSTWELKQSRRPT